MYDHGFRWFWYVLVDLMLLHEQTHDPTIGRPRNLPLQHVQKLEPPRNHDLVASLALISLKRPARSKSQMLSAVAMRAMEITKSSSLLRLARLTQAKELLHTHTHHFIIDYRRRIS